ncbi:MAG: hypothetical protein MAG551_00036 [Candidatus Scalindua arabica]|uniref:Uncharacterized protein n=1 Tax=Candidatus Scalindua arabica TaxID=1127984 RepID=A0A941W0Q8_9BACT|nr:hypothetical protein [Candidatus Scalindua arabica]
MATQFATIQKKDKNALWIELRYEAPKEEYTGLRLERSDRLFDVPFEKWEQHTGQTIDLSTWEGTGEGMIGGPTKQQIEFYLDGPLAFIAAFTDEKEIRNGIKELRQWLKDENIDFSKNARNQIEEEIRYANYCIKEGRKFRNNQKKKC